VAYVSLGRPPDAADYLAAVGRSFPSRKGPARPMLFAQKVLAPGHNRSIPEMSTLRAPAEPGLNLKANRTITEV